MTTEILQKKLLCDKCGEARVVRAVIRKEKLGFMEEAASEALEEQHRKLSETETDPLQVEVHILMAEAQRKMRREGLVKLEMRCPHHPRNVDYSLYFEDFPKGAQLIKDHVFLCGKCGKSVEIGETSPSGKFKAISIRCAEHGQGKRKISTSIYETLLNPSVPVEPVAPEAKPSVPVEPVAPEAKPPGEVKISYCWNCGTSVAKSDSKFCFKCGVSLKPK